MDNLYDALKELAEKRHSCRRFTDETVTETQLRKVLDVAARAPFASGRSSWKIAVVRDRAQLHALAEAVREESEAMAAKMEDENAAWFRKYAQNFLFFEQAPVLLLPYCRESATLKSMLREAATPEILAYEHDNLTKSLSCVAMLLLLAAESVGLGACYMTGPLLAGKRINTLLGLHERFLVGAFIPLGHPATHPDI